jgi:hypothetical protein
MRRPYATPAIQTLERLHAELGRKISGGHFFATFFPVCLATMELEGVILEEI